MKQTNQGECIFLRLHRFSQANMHLFVVFFFQNGGYIYIYTYIGGTTVMLRQKIIRHCVCETVCNKQVQVTSSDILENVSLWPLNHKITVRMFTSCPRTKYQVVFGDSEIWLVVIMAYFRFGREQKRRRGSLHFQRAARMCNHPEKCENSSYSKSRAHTDKQSH